MSTPTPPPDDLTFAELRLANILHEHAGRLDVTNPRNLAEVLADLVIHADRLASASEIDLARAIRARFALK